MSTAMQAALRRAAPELAAGGAQVLQFEDIGAPVVSDVPYAVLVRTDAAGGDAAGAGSGVTIHFTEGAVRLLAVRLPAEFSESVLVSSRSRHADWLTFAALQSVAPDSDWWVYASSSTEMHRGEMSLFTMAGAAPLELLFQGSPNAPAGGVAASAPEEQEPGDFSDSSGDFEH